jgi:O-antigen chain-terminating methyltransferase
MTSSASNTDDLLRLRLEREKADRTYNDALTALDAAIQRLRDLPPPPPAFDDQQVAVLNQRWEVLRDPPPSGRPLVSRLRAQVWRLVAPLFERQQAFNAALVDHVNRNAAFHRELPRSIRETQALHREEFERLVTFESKLVQYAQQITPYVDTKDRYVAGLPHGLAAAISGLSDELHKRWESMAAREQRYEAQVNEVRTTLSVMQRAVQALRREIEERRGTPPPSGVSSVQSQAPAAFDAYKYVGFEDAFRGSPDQIRERAEAYAADFAGRQDVLDIGCGRGEFLDVLRERGISARGVDLNDEMAALCRDRGLDVAAGDALEYLLAQPDGSLGGLFAAQVVEHLEPGYLMRLLDAAYHKLRPGSKIVLETINAACWYAFFSSYIRDLTHVRPLHPETLQYLLVASGFQRVEVRYRSPFPEESKLQPLPALASGGAADETGHAASPEATSVFNENVRKLNGLLFTHLDYAAIGERM